MTVVQILLANFKIHHAKLIKLQASFFELILLISYTLMLEILSKMGFKLRQ